MNTTTTEPTYISRAALRRTFPGWRGWMAQGWQRSTVGLRGPAGTFYVCGIPTRGNGAALIMEHDTRGVCWYVVKLEHNDGRALSIVGHASRAAAWAEMQTQAKGVS